MHLRNIYIISLTHVTDCKFEFLFSFYLIPFSYLIMYNSCMPILDVSNLNLSFKSENNLYQALFDVSFSLEKSKTLALVGESGCGKTISAMSILGLLPKNATITSGKINFENQNLLDLTQQELQHIRGSKIALIPQDPMTSLNPLYTIGNQLMEVLKIHQKVEGDEAYQKAINSLKMVQIPSPEERLKSYPHEFSGGMKQRAIIAMALACNAQIIIADEPTTALDVTIQAQIMNLLQEIKQQTQTAILLITHDLALVSENADNIAVMYAGRIVETAPAKEFFANPKHPYSIALLNAIPNNNTKLETIEGQPPAIQQNISGCRFHSRCKKCMEICTQQVPPNFNVGENHFCACWLNQ